MSGEQELGADTTTQGPPPSYGRADNSIVSSSQLSPKSPVRARRRDSRQESRYSWGEPGEERVDPKRRSTVTFGGATSVAPSDSISKVKSRPGRSSAEGTQHSRTTRRRSAPWQDHDYRSNFPSKAGSSQGGTAWTGDRAPLTENNLEEFNERQPPRSEKDTQPVVERDVEFEEVDRKSTRKSRRDSGIETQSHKTRAGWIGADDRKTSKATTRIERESGGETQTRAGWVGADDRRTSKATTRVERDSAQGDRTLVTTRQQTEVDRDGYGDEEVETKSKSRYESYSRPTQSSKSKVSTKKQSYATGLYEDEKEQLQSSSAGASQSKRAKTAVTKRSRPPTMPPESEGNRETSRDIAVAAVATNAGSRPDGRSRAQSRFFEEDNVETSGQTEARTEKYSSRQTEAQTRQTEVKSEREVETSGKSSSPRTQASGRSRALSRPTQPEAAGPATSPSSTNSPTSPTNPSPVEGQWERRVHVIETRNPDGRIILDKEITMRRIRPQQQLVGA